MDKIGQNEYELRNDYKMFHDAYVGGKLQEYYKQFEVPEQIRQFQKNNLTVYGVK